MGRTRVLLLRPGLRRGVRSGSGTVPRRPSAAGRKLDAPARAAALRRRGEPRSPGPRRAVRHARARRHALRLVRDDDREGPRRRSRRRGRLGQSGNRTRRGAGRRARRRAADRGRPGERLRRPDGARRDGGRGRRAVPPRGRRPAPPDRRRGAADGARPRALDGRRDVPGPQPRPPRPDAPRLPLGRRAVSVGSRAHAPASEREHGHPDRDGDDRRAPPLRRDDLLPRPSRARAVRRDGTRLLRGRRRHPDARAPRPLLRDAGARARLDGGAPPPRSRAEDRPPARERHGTRGARSPRSGPATGCGSSRATPSRSTASCARVGRPSTNRW